MEQDVCIAMPYQVRVMRDVDAADPKGTTGCQSMCVVADANSKPLRSSISLCVDGLRRKTNGDYIVKRGKRGIPKRVVWRRDQVCEGFTVRLGELLERFDLDCRVIFN